MAEYDVSNMTDAELKQAVVQMSAELDSRKQTRRRQAEIKKKLSSSMCGTYLCNC